jgi:hypothetical protein
MRTVKTAGQNFLKKTKVKDSRHEPLKKRMDKKGEEKWI